MHRDMYLPIFYRRGQHRIDQDFSTLESNGKIPPTTSHKLVNMSTDTRRETNPLFFFKEVNATAVAGCPVVKVVTAFHFPPF